ncbi:o-succinylbenzoate synthase [Marihabitans asiaticum]|uniref:o-succinylbenzoate synthase n=1 Tax=Marihabitans asiaticum TaxID=415218 RepID=A0A560WHH2_9MICO|nr:o-succinylbenzoate synthase [Marihabitans asiaticum]TWD17127.1 O-succinylbenzoate synthase [Marihabitans asiaticum]
MTSLEQLQKSLRVVSIPLRVRFRGLDRREVALVKGAKGWAEFSPFVEYEPPEASRWLAAALEAADTGWPAPLRDEIPCNATVPAVTAEAVPAVIARFDGCRTAKVKVAERGQSLTDDLARVAAVRDVLGPDGQVRLDANGGWSVDQAVDAISRLAPFALEYVEQPCATATELREVRMALARNGIDVRIAADESIRKAEDPLRVARLEAADVVVVKVAPLGGVRSALRVVQDCGLPAVVSSALDSSVGIRAGVALAAALPELPFACGLGTVNLLDGDVTHEPLVPRAGSLPVREVVVDEARLDELAAPPERVQWWRERLGAAWALL